MSPNGPPKGGPIGENGDEPEGVGKGRGARARAPSPAAGRGCGDAAAGELSTREAIVEALSGARGGRTEAPQRRAGVEPISAGGVPAEGLAAGAGEVRRGRGGALRADVGGGAFGVGGRADGGCGNLAALDAGGRVVEPRTEAAGTPPSARAERAFWGDGADGWQLSSVVRAAGSAGLLDGSGR